MAITEKRPSTKYTVGAQYICFNEDPDWDAAEYETDVLKLPTVVDINIADNSAIIFKLCVKLQRFYRINKKIKRYFFISKLCYQRGSVSI